MKGWCCSLVAVNAVLEVLHGEQEEVPHLHQLQVPCLIGLYTNEKHS
jgi:hypothetical protein